MDLENGLQASNGVGNEIDGATTCIDDNNGVANLEAVGIQSMQGIDGCGFGFGDEMDESFGRARRQWQGLNGPLAGSLGLVLGKIAPNSWYGDDEFQRSAFDDALTKLLAQSIKEMLGKGSQIISDKLISISASASTVTGNGLTNVFQGWIQVAIGIMSAHGPYEGIEVYLRILMVMVMTYSLNHSITSS